MIYQIKASSHPSVAIRRPGFIHVEVVRTIGLAEHTIQNYI